MRAYWGAKWQMSGRLLAAAFLLSGCTAAELAVDLAKKIARQEKMAEQSESLETGTVKAQPRYKVGDPYQIGGSWYYPDRNLQYDETGIASWYGDEFAGRLTANGEIFDPNLVTAAHKTLPMPSVVRVTNLDNGRSLVLRVNDRGPYVPGRIIDLSREAARLIGFQKKGIARVRVQILAEQSLRLEKLAREGQFPSLNERVVSNDMPEANGAAKPKVSLTAKTTRAQPVKRPAGNSALDLLSDAQTGTVREGDALQTDIWIQIGAFHSAQNARNVLNKLAARNPVELSETFKDGRTLYRARLGPVANVQDADRLLDEVLNMGYSGARIVID